MGRWYKNRIGHDWTGTGLDRTELEGRDWTGQDRRDRCRIVHGTRLNRTGSERGMIGRDMIGRDMMNRTGLVVDILNGTGLDGNYWDSKKYG